MTPHIEAKKEQIAKTVIMPGDPLRAKYIAENFLEDVVMVNSIRNMYGYTGKYKGKEITVFASGMGMPSMGIYCYELYKFYDVENIIRIGTSGALNKDIDLLDIIVVDKTYTNGNFSIALNHVEKHISSGSKNLNEIIETTADENNIRIIKGNTNCNEVFDYYDEDFEAFIKSLPSDLNILASEMEAFALFYTAEVLNKNAACIISVVDSRYREEVVPAKERENNLDKMIELALESSLKI